jgi:putative ABC transport system permease protein
MSAGANGSVLRTQLAGVRRRPGRLVMTGVSVLVAAFVVFGTAMAQQITIRTTLDNFSGTPAATSLVVTAESGTSFSDAQVSAVRQVPGVAEVAPRIETGAPIAGGTSQRWLRLDADPGTGPMSRVRVVSGSYPDGAGEVAVSCETAKELAVAPGARLDLVFPLDGEGEKKRTVAVTVTGVVEAGAGRVATGYAPASTVTAIASVVNLPRLDIRAEPGVSAQTLHERLRVVLQGTQVLIAPGDVVRMKESREAVDDLDELFAVIAMFVAIAVVAAALVATSTFRIVFAQRLRQLALLRTIGASRGQLVRALTVEGALVGLVAGAVGVLLALAAGWAAPAVARAAGQNLSTPGVPAVVAIAVVLGAVLVTVGAVLAPALSAAGVSPLQALRSASTAAGERGIGQARLGAGLFLATGAAALVGLIISQLPEPGDETYDPALGLMVIVASGALAFLALIALGPLLVRPVLAAAGWPLRRVGPTGTLAVGGVGGAPRRAAAVSVVVALGVTLVAGTLVGVACLQGYVDRRLAVGAPADFKVHGGDAGVSADVVRRIEALPELAEVTGYRMVDVSIGDHRVIAVDLGLTALPAVRQMYPATGTLSGLGPGRVVVNDELARELGVRAGDSVTFTGATGPVVLSVAATLPGDAPLNADLVLAPADLDRLGAAPQPTGVLANAARNGPAGRTEATRAIETVIGSDPESKLTILAEDRDDANADISLVATTTLGLLALTVLIAVVGVATTTSLTVLERARESGLLRALGLGRTGLRTMISIEAGLYGVVGGVLGLFLGVPYAWLAIRVLNIDAPLLLPVWQLLAVFAGLAVITALAGLLPARRAARVSPVVALGTTE